MVDYIKNYTTYNQNKSNKLNSNNKNFKITETYDEGILEFKIKDKIEKITIKFNHYHNTFSFLKELYHLKGKHLHQLQQLVNKKIYSQFSNEENNNLLKLEKQVKQINELIDFYYISLHEIINQLLQKENLIKKEISNKFKDIIKNKFDSKKNKQYNYNYFENLKNANTLLHNFKNNNNIETDDIYSHLYNKLDFNFQNFLIIRHEYNDIYNLINDENKLHIKNNVQIPVNNDIQSDISDDYNDIDDNNENSDNESIKENIDSDKETESENNEESEDDTYNDNEKGKNKNKNRINNDNDDDKDESDKDESDKDESDKDESDKDESDKDESDKDESDEDESDKDESDKDESDKDESDEEDDSDNKQKGSQNQHEIKTIRLHADTKHISNMFNKYKNKSDKQHRHRDKEHHKKKHYNGGNSGEKLYSKDQLRIISDMLDNVLMK